MRPALQIWTAPKCQAGAVALAALPATTAAQITETITGSESGQLTLPQDIALACGVAEGRVVRGILPRRGVREWVILSVADGAPGTTTTVTLGPLKQLLTLRGTLRRITATGTALDWPARTGTVATLLQQTVLTTLAADQLEWLSLGTIEYTAPLTLPAFAAQTRGQVLATLETLTGHEVVLRRVGEDIGYAIDLVAQQNITVAPWLLEAPASAVAISRTRSLLETATAVIGVGEDNAPLGDVQWIGGEPQGSGPWWIPLTDPVGGPAPIREDGQCAGALLALPDGTTVPVETSRASDSAVRVTTLGTYATGQRVILREATGGPVALLTSPSALAASRGLVVAQVRTRGARQERNLLRNGGFETAGLASWTTNGSPNHVEIPRSELGVTTTGKIATTRAANTGTGTALAVKNFPANYWIRRGHQLVVDGVTLTLAADAIPSTTGALTLTLASPGLPATYADNTPFTLLRAEVRTLTLDGDQSPLAPVLRFRDSNTDGMFTGGTGSVVSSSGTYATSAGATVGLAEYVDAGVQAGKVSVNVQSANARGALTWPTYGTDIFSVLGASLTINASTPQTGTVTYTGSIGGTVGVGTRLRYFANGLWRLLRVTSVAGGTLGVEAEHASAIAYFPTSTLEACNVLLSDGSTWVFTATRETRTLLLNGSHSSGATSVAFKAQANLATRNWVGTDTIQLTRNLSATLAITSIASSAGFTDENDQPIRGMSVVVNIDTATSTIDNLTKDVDWSVNQVVFDIGGISWVLGGVSGSTASLDADIWYSPTPFTTPQTLTTSWSRTDSYALSGTANWASTGRVTLTLASAVPTGRSYARGWPVKANWVGGFMRLHSTLAAGATTVDVFGHDEFYFATTSPADNRRGAVYRIQSSGSTIPIAGETIDCAADVQVGSGGTANVTLRAANTNSVAADSVVTIRVPALLDADDRTTGSVLRLLWGPGSATPANTVAAQQSSSEVVVVPVGGRVTVTGRAWFAITPETLAAGQTPVITIVDPDTNTILGTGAPSGGLTASESPTELILTAQAEITTTRRVALRVYGGSSTTFSRWHILKEAMLAITTKTDVGYDPEGFSRVAWHRCQDVLALRKSAARYSVRALDRGALTDSGSPPVLGQPIRLRASALDLDTTQRIVRLVWRWPGAELVEIEAGLLTPRLTDVDVSL